MANFKQTRQFMIRSIRQIWLRSRKKHPQLGPLNLGGILVAFMTIFMWHKGRRREGKGKVDTCDIAWAVQLDRTYGNFVGEFNKNLPIQVYSRVISLDQFEVFDVDFKSQIPMCSNNTFMSYKKSPMFSTSMVAPKPFSCRSLAYLKLVHHEGENITNYFFKPV